MNNFNENLTDTLTDTAQNQQKEPELNTTNLLARFAEVNKRASREGWFSPKKESTSELDVLSQYIAQQTGIKRQSQADGYIFSGYSNKANVGYLSGIFYGEKEKAIKRSKELALKYGDSRSISKLDDLNSILSTVPDDKAIYSSLNVIDRLNKASELGISASNVISDDELNNLERIHEFSIDKYINEHSPTVNRLIGLGKGAASIPTGLVDFALDTASLCLTDVNNRWGDKLTASLGLTPEEGQETAHKVGQLLGALGITMATGGASTLVQGGAQVAGMTAGGHIGSYYGGKLGSLSGNQNLEALGQNVGGFLGAVGGAKLGNIAYNQAVNAFNKPKIKPLEIGAQGSSAISDNLLAEEVAPETTQGYENLDKAIQNVKRAGDQIVGYEKSVNLQELNPENKFNVRYNNISDADIVEHINQELLNNENSYISSERELKTTANAVNEQLSSNDVGLNLEEIYSNKKLSELDLSQIDKSTIKALNEVNLKNAIANAGDIDAGALMNKIEEAILKNEQASSAVKNQVRANQQSNLALDTEQFNSDLSINNNTANIEQDFSALKDNIESAYKEQFNRSYGEIANRMSEVLGEKTITKRSPIFRETSGALNEITSGSSKLPVQNALAEIGIKPSQLNEVLDSIRANASNEYDFIRNVNSEVVKPMERAFSQLDSKLGAQNKFNAFSSKMRSLESNLIERFAPEMIQQKSLADSSYKSFKTADAIKKLDLSSYNSLNEYINKIKDVKLRERLLGSSFELRAKLLGKELSGVYKNGLLDYKKLENINLNKASAISNTLSPTEIGRLKEWMNRANKVNQIEGSFNLNNLKNEGTSQGKMMGTLKSIATKLARKGGIMASSATNLFFNLFEPTNSGMTLGTQASILEGLYKIFNNKAFKMNVISQMV